MGPGPMGPKKRDHGPMGPWVMGPWARGRAPGRGHPGGRAPPFPKKPSRKLGPGKNDLLGSGKMCFWKHFGTSGTGKIGIDIIGIGIGIDIGLAYNFWNWSRKGNGPGPGPNGPGPNGPGPFAAL